MQARKLLTTFSAEAFFSRMDTTQKPKWSDIRVQLQSLEIESLISLVKDLYALSSANKRFLEARFPLTLKHSESTLADYKQQISFCFYGKSSFPSGEPKLREARNLVSSYRKATNDHFGTLDLMLYYVEIGTRFTNDFGDIDEPFYNSLESMLREFRDSLYKAPEPAQAYLNFSKRLSTLGKEVAYIGWGYGDYVVEVLAEMEADFEEEQDPD